MVGTSSVPPSSTPPQESWSKKLLRKRIPIVGWLPSYTKNDVLADIISGLTVGLTMMPQSLAYAGLAGIPPQYGLYTAFIGSFTYVFFGTVKEVSIGPTSLMSILTFAYVRGGPIELVILLSFIAGCVEFLMGVLHLGFLVDFISPCITSGFTSASAVIIMVAQFKNFFGISLKSHDTLQTLKELSQRYGEVRLYDTLLGCFCIVFLVAFKQLNKIKIESPRLKKTLWFLSISKNAIIVLICSILGACLSQDGQAPFKLTGPVPRGMPAFSFPSLTTQMGNNTLGYSEMLSSLGSGLIVIPLVAVLANVAIAKAYSADTVVDASQEMISLGLCNILGSFVKAMPSCGAFTRSSVASSSDVRTPLQGIYSGTVIILALSFFAPYFYFIPKSTLAAVLITAVSSLIDYEIFPVLWRCNKVDFFWTLVTFVTGIIMGVETAVVIGAVGNAVVLLKVWSRPKVYVEVQKFQDKATQYIYIKPELGLLYPAADFVTECVKKAYKKNNRLPIVLDCKNIMRLDYSAAKTIENLLDTFNETDPNLVLINVHPAILKVLKSVTDTEHLRLCKSSEQLSEVTFDKISSEEKPLLTGTNNNYQRRKSSTKSAKSGINEERKMSLYELE